MIIKQMQIYESVKKMWLQRLQSVRVDPYVTMDV